MVIEVLIGINNNEYVVYFNICKLKSKILEDIMYIFYVVKVLVR